jgi:preprotein translocase subunit SecG
MSADLLEQVILIVHLLLALAIIGLIMLQQGKGAEMGASFGAGASQTLFGSSGSGNVLTRTTAWLVAFFFASSFGLAVMAKQKTEISDDLGIPVPFTEELPAGDVPAARDELPGLNTGDEAELPPLPGAGLEADVPVNEDVPTVVTDGGNGEP